MGATRRAASPLHQTRPSSRRPLVRSRRTTRYAPSHLHSEYPGGKRDPEDADDRVTAERETREEIGLNLTSDNSIYCGGLDQRLVSTSATTVPLMTLAPYGTPL